MEGRVVWVYELRHDFQEAYTFSLLAEFLLMPIHSKDDVEELLRFAAFMNVLYVSYFLVVN
jgi:hypothetical protein